MLRTLLKKQLMEFFRSYYYNPKNNQARSRGRTVMMFVLYGILIFGVLGGTFGMMAASICGQLVAQGCGWLYLTLFSLLAILLGAFGSVFSTFSGLYLAKDNDLLLSMPIPPRYILAARLLGVYLAGLMLSAPVLLPAVLVYLLTATFTVSRLLGCLVLLVWVTVFVMLLSCALGWVVAKLSLRLKNKSFLTVLIALVGIGIYYFLYFRAQQLLQSLAENAMRYSDQIKGSAYALYLFGRIGEGDWLAIGLYLAALAALAFLTFRLLAKSFLGIATATGAEPKAVYREKTAVRRSPDRALLGKELRRFAASPGYMLNCGLGMLMLAVGGVLLLIYGERLVTVFDSVLGKGGAALALGAFLCMVCSTNDMTASSVSLEGKSIWLAQSLPISGWQALRAKLRMQLLLSGIPSLFAVLCAVLVLHDDAVIRAGMALFGLSGCVLFALWGLFLNLKLPNLHWTNETLVLKQSGSVAFALFTPWAYLLALGGLYLLIGDVLGNPGFLGLCAALTAILCLPLLVWLRKKGAQIFSAL